MTRVTRPLLPTTQRRAKALGERLRLARLRRRMSLSEMATRTNTSRLTLARLERGELSVGLAVLTRVLGALGMEDHLDLIAQDDPLGQRLEDLALKRPRRSPGKEVEP